MMEELAVDVMTKVLDFVELPERLKLVQCSNGLLRLVTRDCTALWTIIDFSKVPNGRLKESMTDETLSALLERVNAREVTKVLSVYECREITGSGLEPMRGSQVLARINLPSTIVQRGHDTSDEPLVMNILRSMFSYKLMHVRFLQRSGSNETNGTYRIQTDGSSRFCLRWGSCLEMGKFLCRLAESKVRAST